ncbi:MAG: hypothetical protein CO170_04195 [candidate division SR1 bacterium CG_4_9_14_3_um_filter_40_9]|nr:MAG: hypothetical protein CO170_04195 [candidate division SR1 bacterium CG_4_9_14_3_um_filter_40_9]
MLRLLRSSQGRAFFIYLIFMLLAVDKPHGITSFDVIRKLKIFFSKQKTCPAAPVSRVGHSGTLDPFATGLMLVGVGSDTKKLTELTGLDKSYIATIDFSQDSDTWDLQYRKEIADYRLQMADGKAVGIEKENKIILSPNLQQVQDKLNLLIPAYILPIPTFSAKKKDGKRSYDLARKGKSVEESKEMKIYSYKIIKYEFPLLGLQLDVGSGTYIRSIAHWLGEQFGLGGILTALRRTSIGDFKLADYDMKIIPETEIKYCKIQ